MFGLLSSAVLNAVEAMAPPLPLQEEFAYRWTEITSYYMEKKANELKVPVEETPLALHLEEMSRLLDFEEREAAKTETNNEGKSAVGPILEYLLHHKVLETMGVLAQTDSPPGTCQLVMRFMTRLLTGSRDDLLANGSVFHPVQKVIMICGKLVAGPYERSQVEFLACISQKVKQNPQLLACFVRDKFPLVTSLLALLLSHDQEISTIAGDAILALVSVLDELSSHVLTQETPFSSKIMAHLCSLYETIPRDLKPEEVVFAMSAASSAEVSITSFSTSTRRFLCFLRWFVFLDMLVHQSSCHQFSTALLDQLHQDFFVACLLPDLVGVSDENALLTTTLVSNFLRNLNSHLIAVSIGQFLCCHSPSDSGPGLKKTLIDRCRIKENRIEGHFLKTTSGQLSMATMQLLEEVLNRPSLAVLESLILSPLLSRAYFDPTVESSQFPFNSSGGSLFAEDAEDLSPGSSPTGFISSSRIHRILQYFTSLVPDELKSCGFAEETGYEPYVREAQKHFNECASFCDWSWPTEPVHPQSHCETPDEDNGRDTDSDPEADSAQNIFFEGDFLAMIFDNLQNMVNLPYEVNLQITSLISKSTLFPHPNLNEYLLDPTLPLSRGCRSLFGVLHKLVDQLQVAVQGVSNLKLKLKVTRQVLLGENETSETSITTFEEHHVKVLEALIVIEEFCKELAAIAFVKYHRVV